MILPCRNPVHLYRSLLREAGYLFHPVVQNFHIEHIKWSFRRQRAKQLTPSLKSAENDTAVHLSQDESQQLKRARHYLSMLQRANQGYIVPLKNVLKMAFARKGKQRREYMKEFMVPASTEDSSLPLVATEYGKDWRPPAKFSILLRHQIKVQSYLDVSKKKIQNFPKIPEKNKWDKPFPKSRIKGIYQKWYAKHAGIVMPPLQEKQWLDVLQSTTGDASQPRSKVPQRRAVGAVRVFSEEHEDSGWLEKIDGLIMTSAQRNHHVQSVRADMGNPHKTSNRFLRRRIREAVLQNTPTILADSSTGRLATRWESGTKPLATPSTCTESQMNTLFD